MSPQPWTEIDANGKKYVPATFHMRNSQGQVEACECGSKMGILVPLLASFGDEIERKTLLNIHNKYTVERPVGGLSDVERKNRERNR